MDGWVGHAGWPIADVWSTKWSSVQLAVWRRTGKVRRPRPAFYPLCHAANKSLFLSSSPKSSSLSWNFKYLTTSHHINIKLSVNSTISSYCIPRCTLSEGEHWCASVQWPWRKGLLSRNQPESTIPRSRSPRASCDNWRPTRSRFINTPVPPALHTNIDFKI